MAQRFSPSRSMTTTRLPARFVSVSHSDGTIRFEWEETVEISQELRGQPQRLISRVTRKTEACIGLEEWNRSRAGEIVIGHRAGYRCPVFGRFRPVPHTPRRDLQEQVYFPEFGIGVEIPAERHAHLFVAPVANRRVGVPSGRVSVAVVMGGTQTNRLYVFLSDGTRLAYRVVHQTERGSYVSRYVSQGWEASDPWWLKRSRKLRVRPMTFNGATSVISFRFQDGKEELQQQFFTFDNPDDSWAPGTVLFGDREGSYRESRGYAFLLYPLTLPLDVVTAPLQLIALGPFEYLFLVYCTLGISCRTPLG